MDSRKNKGMGKIFPCLRANVVDDDGKPVKVRNGKIMYPDEITTSLSSSSSTSDADSSLDRARSKGSSRRRFARALKAVLFDASLTKKIREKKSRKNSFRSNSMSEKIGNPINDKISSFEESSDADEMNTSNSSRSSLFDSSTNASSSLSSSCSSSMNLTSRSLTERRGSSRVDAMDKGMNSVEKNASSGAPNPAERKESFRGITKSMELQKQKHNSAGEKIEQYNSSTIGLCLLVLSLLVLVFWGKICAIFCTSVWLFFTPRRIRGLGSPVGSVNMDSEGYRKRVIMEGLLNRNRSRAAQ